MISKVQANEMAQLYRKVNESFNKKLVFRIGIDAGFFAEFKYLVHAVIYCLEHEIQLQLYSHGAISVGAKAGKIIFCPFAMRFMMLIIRASTYIRSKTCALCEASTPMFQRQAS